MEEPPEARPRQALAGGLDGREQAKAFAKRVMRTGTARRRRPTSCGACTLTRAAVSCWRAITAN